MVKVVSRKIEEHREEKEEKKRGESPGDSIKIKSR